MRFMSDAVLESGACLSGDGDATFWRLPTRDEHVDDFGAFLRFVQMQWPGVDNPAVFGLHANASITKDLQGARALLGLVLRTQSRSGGAQDSDRDGTVRAVARDVLARLPPQFNEEEARMRFPIKWDDCMNTVLVQELERYNRLIRAVRDSVGSALKALDGLVVASDATERLCEALLFGRVPAQWRRVSYPTERVLGAYVADLGRRLSWWRRWYDRGSVPARFWLSGFFFTQAFLTATLQNFARAHTEPIENVVFDFCPVDDRGDADAGADAVSGSASSGSGGSSGSADSASQGVPLAAAPGEGCVVYGIFLEGCRWDADAGQLAEPRSRELYSAAPQLWFKPVRQQDVQEVPCYECPLYNTNARRGELSTTGHSTNFVLLVRLPTEETESFWVQRGAAMLLQLST